MKRLLLKSLYIVAAARYPRIQPHLRYCVRDNYYCRLNQLRYVADDYVRKKKYKVIDYEGEFQWEIFYVLPFAYWHHLNGTLRQTISAVNTREFYFFSENHLERYPTRNWKAGFDFYDVPNTTHHFNYDFSKWAPVPLKAQYRNDRFVYDKPTLVIANKYNMEWDKPPLNFIDIPTLDRIITAYKSKYQIIYNRPLSNQIVDDNSEILDLGEHAWLRENHPDVIQMNDLYARHRATVNNYNHLQLLVYANCERFVSVHGGTAALASYFGGVNTILSNPAGGMEHDFNDYATIFPAASGARILHARYPDEIMPLLQAHY